MLFQERVCEAIKNKDMRQLHIREGNITNWKKGLNLPSIEVFYQLCLLLDESADYLLGITD